MYEEKHQSERTLIKYILSNKNKKQVIDCIDLMRDYEFYNSGLNYLYDIVKDYTDKYSTIITAKVLKAEINKITDEISRISIENEIEQLKSTNIIDSMDYFLDEFDKNRLTSNTMLGIQKLIDTFSSKDDNIKDKLSDILLDMIENTTKTINADNNYVSIKDIDSWLVNDNRKTISTGFDYLDTIMDGGLGLGELGVIVGSAGAGKSWLLSAIGLNSVKLGKKVLHLSLELYARQTLARYGSLLIETNAKNLIENKNKVIKAVNELSGELIVKTLISRAGSTVNTVRGLANKHNPDIIILDYADKLTSNENYKNNTYLEQGKIYDELRALSFDTSIPIWTASQANRIKEDEGSYILQANIADSYRKMMVADFVMSIHRNQHFRSNNKAGYAILKNRFGYDGMTFNGNCDFGSGIIEIINPNYTKKLDIKTTAKDIFSELLKKKKEEGDYE
jgi:archaellum biogenesis ATPase FlaH